MTDQPGLTPEEIRDGLQKLAGLAIVLEVAEHTKTAASGKILSKLKKLLPKMPWTENALLRSELSGTKRSLAEATSGLAGEKARVGSLIDELASAERLARGAVYAGGVAVPAAAIGSYMYGKKKGKAEGKDAFIRELLG